MFLRINMPKPKLSIIITHHKTPALLKLCVKSIIRTLKDESYEIIVVDSESETETEEMISENFPAVVFIPFEQNVGYAKLVNAGIRESHGDFLLVLNSDIVILENSVERLLESMRSNPEIGVSWPRLLNVNGSPQDSCFRFYTPKTIVFRRTFLRRFGFARKALEIFVMKDLIADDRPIEADWLMGSAMLIRRSALKKVGPLDENFFMYFEDVDWCRRFWENGYKVVYFPQSKMVHYHQKASRKKGGILDVFINKFTRTHIRSAFLYFSKHGWRQYSH